MAPANDRLDNSNLSNMNFIIYKTEGLNVRRIFRLTTHLLPPNQMRPSSHRILKTYSFLHSSKSTHSAESC